jgi:hypothetical protein
VKKEEGIRRYKHSKDKRPDRGMSSDENRVILQRAGGHYTLGEKLRDNQEARKLALCFKGCYHKVRDHLEVKEIVVGGGERPLRFIPVFNPEQAEKDKATREKPLEDAALGYKQLMEVERAFMTLKTTLGYEPMSSGRIFLKKWPYSATDPTDG